MAVMNPTPMAVMTAPHHGIRFIFSTVEEGQRYMKVYILIICLSASSKSQFLAIGFPSLVIFAGLIFLFLTLLYNFLYFYNAHEEKDTESYQVTERARGEIWGKGCGLLPGH